MSAWVFLSAYSHSSFANCGIQLIESFCLFAHSLIAIHFSNSMYINDCPVMAIDDYKMRVSYSFGDLLFYSFSLFRMLLIRMRINHYMILNACAIWFFSIL